MNKRQKGFTLIELLIVVAIILIIAAIAIPNLLKSQMAAHQASAVGSVRTIVTSEVTYQSTYGIGFAAKIDNLGGASPCTASSTTACLLDPLISTAPYQKSGYTLSATGAAGPNGGTTLVSFETAAVPISVGSSGQNTYCSDESGVIRFDPTGGADPGTDTACEKLNPLQ
jgi:type IV pilus assembly protein PilA